MIPGKKPSMVNKMFIQKCLPKPTCRNTPKGGRMIANIMRMMSMIFPCGYNFKVNVLLKALTFTRITSRSSVKPNKNLRHSQCSDSANSVPKAIPFIFIFNLSCFCSEFAKAFF
jgi:hypothetical protein